MILELYHPTRSLGTKILAISWSSNSWILKGTMNAPSCPPRLDSSIASAEQGTEEVIGSSVVHTDYMPRNKYDPGLSDSLSF